MKKTEELENRIEALEARLNLLEGRPHGPITMTEARLANERGDKATVKRFMLQESERLKAMGQINRLKLSGH